MRFAFWVVSREQSVPGNPVYGDALDARPLSGGEELDHLRYNGPLAILGAEGLKICEAQVEVGHVYGRGMSWFLIPSLPLTFPFLLSDDLSIELVYDGEVAFSLDPSQKKNLRWKGTEDVVIAGKNWFGVLTLTLKRRRAPAMPARLRCFAFGKDVESAREEIAPAGQLTVHLGQIRLP